MNERVLLVGDDGDTEVLSKDLAAVGFDVTPEPRDIALDRFRQTSPDVVVLDAIPSPDGLGICRGIRSEGRTPIVMLSPETDVHHAISALDSGADDYVRKPFVLEELVARIKALLRRAEAPPPESVMTVGDLEIDPFAFRVRKRGEELGLTATEFRLLCELARHAGQVLSRESMLDRVWGYDYLGDSRLVDMAIKRLRDKIEDDPHCPRRITTVRGVGYRLEQD